MPQAMGTVETRGLIAAIDAADAMLKAARVQIRDFTIVGSGLVSVIVEGDVAAVQAAVASGQSAAEKVGVLISSNVIANPSCEVEKLLG